MRAGSHRVHGFHVERLLAVPTERVTLLGALQLVREREDDLRELRRAERMRRVVSPRVFRCVLVDRRRRERVDHRNRCGRAGATAVDRRRNAVGRPQLAGLVTARRMARARGIRRHMRVCDVNLLRPVIGARRRIPNPAGAGLCGADCPVVLFGCSSDCASSTPMTPVTELASSAGTERFRSAAQLTAAHLVDTKANRERRFDALR